MKKKNAFYNYVRTNISGIPCSACFDNLYDCKISEETFMIDMNSKYALNIINFEQYYHQYQKDETNHIVSNHIVSNHTTYHLKVNNQFFLEYNATTGLIDEINDMILTDIAIYTSEMNSQDFILFLDYINDLIKNTTKNK